MSDQIKCPKCESFNIHTDKKGFSGVKAVAGAVVAGPVGVLAGTHGSGKIICTCLNCGKNWDNVKLIKQEKEIKQAETLKGLSKKADELKKNKHLFYKHYESNDYDTANQYLELFDKYGFERKDYDRDDIHSCYIYWKKRDKDTAKGNRDGYLIIISIAILIILFFYWLF